MLHAQPRGEQIEIGMLVDDGEYDSLTGSSNTFR